MTYLSLTVFCAGSLFCASISAAEYTMEGALEWRLRKNSGEISKVDNYSFKVEVKDQKYRLALTSLKGQDYLDYVVSNDGLDTYYLKKSWPSWEAKAQKKNLKEFGFVEPGSFPSFAKRPLQSLWLMCSSHSYLSSSTTPLSIGLEGIGYAPVTSLTHKVEHLAGNPMFIQTVKTYGPNFLDLNGTQVNLPAVFQDGYLLWEVTTIATTNVESSIFPSQFHYRQFFPNSNNPKDKDDLFCIYEASFTVESIRLRVDSPDLLPVAETQALVTDKRFPDKLKDKANNRELGFVYTLPPSLKWKGRDDASLKGELMQITRSIKGKGGAKLAGNVRYVFIALIFIPAGLVAASWYRRKKQNK